MVELNMITSKDILRKTGISRATLNNYIKVGILPKPVVGPPRHGQAGVRQIGYFPSEALERVFKVKLLKSQGKTMGEISRFFSGEVTATTQEGSKLDIERRGGGRFTFHCCAKARH